MRVLVCGVMPPWWRPALWGMRLAAPVLAGIAAVFLCIAIKTCSPISAAIQSALLTINVALTFVEWCLLKPQWPGRRL